MKKISRLISIVVLGSLFIASASQAKNDEEEDCCGLTASQWKTYNAAASNAVLSTTAWQNLSSKPPSELRIDTRRKFSGSTNSEDGKKAPTEVTIGVPITAGTNHFSHVVVEFRHPSKKIVKMWATTIIY